MAAGQKIEVVRKADDPFYEPPAPPPPKSQGVSVAATPLVSAPSVPTATPSAPTPAKEQSDDEAIRNYYAKYDTGSATTQHDTPTGPIDTRFQLPLVPMPKSLEAKFGSKFGSDLFFAETCVAFFKGFFSPKEYSMILFVTARCIYLGDAETGELVISRSISNLRELQQLGDQGLGIRSVSGIDLYVRMPQQRDVLGRVLQKIAAFYTLSVQVRTLSADAEKAFKSDIRYVNKNDAVWEPEEDPRSGVPLVDVPEQHRIAYAPIVPKILHWFGGVNQLIRDWKGTEMERRGCWLTATTLYLSRPGGPQSDGRDITRCIAIEYMGELFDGPEGYFGVIVKEGPAQPHLGLVFDSAEQKEKMIFAIQKCYTYRRKTALKITKCQQIERVIKIEKEKDFKPQLFQMKTKQDLFQLLRGKTA